MVTFKQFFESFSSECSHSEILALIKQFKDNLKKTSLSNDDKYLPLKIIINCLEEHKIDDKDLGKLSHWVNYKANTPYLNDIKNNAILGMLDKYEKASTHHGVPSFKVPYDPNKTSFLVVMIQKMDPRYLLEPDSSEDFEDIYRKYGDSVDICMKLPFSKNVVNDALYKRQSLVNYIKGTQSDNYSEFFVEDSNELDIELYFHNKNRTVDSVLLPNDTLRTGLDVYSYNYNIFANVGEYVYYAIRDDKYIVINDTGEQNV